MKRPGWHSKSCRYAHAKQFRRKRAALCSTRSQVGRVHRDVARQLNKVAPPQGKSLEGLLARTGRILAQQRMDKN